MAVTVGEVQTVLTAKDEMSAAFQTASSNAQNLQNNLQQTGSVADAVGEQFNKLTDRLIALFGIDSIISFTEHTLEAAHSLELLSLQSGVSVEDLQTLGAATEEYGLSSERLGQVIFQLSRRIAGGDDSAATALHMMGLSLSEVQSLDPENLFLTVARSLGTLEGSARDLAATDLFGGRIGKQVLAFSTDVDGAMTAVKNSVSVASAESVKNLAALEVQLSRMETSLRNMAIQTLGQAAGGFNTLKDAVDQGIPKWQIAVAMLKDFAASSVNTGASTSHLADLLADYNFKAKDSADATNKLADAHTAAKQAIDAQAEAQKFMSALILDQAKPILDWQANFLDQMKQLNELTPKNAAAIGVNTQQLKAYEQELKQATTGVTELEHAWEQEANAETALAKQRLTEQQKANVDLEKQEIADLDRMHKNGQVSEQAYQEDLFEIKQKYANMAEGLARDQAAQELKTLQDKEDKAKADAQQHYDDKKIDEETFQEELEAIEEEYAAKRAQVNEKADFDDAEQRKKIWDDYYQYLGEQEDAQAKKAVDDAQNTVNTVKEIVAGMQYDLSTTAGVEQYRSMNTANTVNWSDQQIVDFINKGHTLKDVIEAGGITLYGAYGVGGAGGLAGGINATGGPPTAPPSAAAKSPTPSLAGQVGVGQPPSSGTSGSLGVGNPFVPSEGGTITNHFYVNGTAQSLAREISGILMNQLKSHRQFGAR